MRKPLSGWPGFALAVSLVLVPAAVRAAEKQNPVATGTRAPEIALKDQKGQTWKLADAVKKGKVALVFHRSASW